MALAMIPSRKIEGEKASSTVKNYVMSSGKSGSLKPFSPLPDFKIPKRLAKIPRGSFVRERPFVVGGCPNEVHI
jgi:hypothetical protein